MTNPYGFKVKKPKKAMPKRRVAKPSTKTIKSIVKKEIARNVENKQTSCYLNAVGMTNIGNNTVWSNAGSGLIPISPYTSFVNVTQGTAQGQRIGNEIKTVKSVIKMVMIPRAYDGAVNPQPVPLDVQIIFFKVKGQDAGYPDLTGFWQNGNSQTNLTGTLNDLIQVVNTDKFIYLGQKIVKLGTASYTGNGTSIPDQYFANNDYKFNQILKFDVTKYLNKNYRFNDNDAVPYGNTTWMMINCVRANGTSTQSNGLLGYYWFKQDFIYEDA